MKRYFYLAIILILAFILVKTLFRQEKGSQIQNVLDYDTSGEISLIGACQPYYLLSEKGDTTVAFLLLALVIIFLSSTTVRNFISSIPDKPKKTIGFSAGSMTNN